MRASDDHCESSNVLLFVLTGGALLFVGGASFADETPQQRALVSLSKAARAYEITIDVAEESFTKSTHRGIIRGDAINQETLFGYANLLVDEIKLYPKSLIAKSGLKRITLCEKLSFRGLQCAGVADAGQHQIFIDMSYMFVNVPQLRSAIHHEFFHVFDWTCEEVAGNERWAALNQPGFRYVAPSQLSKDAAQPTDRYPGFFSYYSTTALIEDKAEVFANMFVDLAYVRNRVEKDRLLGAKVRRIQEVLKEHCPEIDEKFWTNLKNRQKKGE